MFERMCYRDDIERFAINNGHRTSAECIVSRGLYSGSRPEAPLLRYRLTE